MKILLVRLRLIGDVVFTTPVIRALRRHYPDAHITYLVEPAAAPVVSTNPDLSEVMVITRRRGMARVMDDVRLAREIRRRQFDLVLDLHGGPRSAWLTWASGAPRRIGYDIDGRTWMYTQAVHRPRGLHPRHSVENQWDLLPAVDAAFPATPSRDEDRVYMPPDPAAEAAVLGRLRAQGIPAGQNPARIIVFHVSAGNPFRRWPESSFASVAAGLVRQSTGLSDRWVLLTAGPSDHEAVQRVLHDARAQAGESASRIVDAGDVTLPELRALLDSAALYIGGDSGPMHVASTSNVPIVGLYGPTLVERSAPWRPDSIPVASVDAGTLPCRPCDQRACAPGDFRCLTSIAPAAVLAAAERLLDLESVR